MNEQLENIKESENKIIIGGKERIIKFGFSAWAKLEEKYGSIQNVEKLEKEMEEKPMTHLIELCWLGLQDKEVYNAEGKRTGKQLDEKTLLDEYSISDVQKISQVIMNALYGSLPKAEDDEESKESV